VNFRRAHVLGPSPEESVGHGATSGLAKAAWRTKGENAILIRMGAHRCKVSFDDSQGCRHSTEVFAASVYEAAAMGVKAIRNQGVVNDEAALTITVEVQTTTVHQLTWTKLQHWLNSNSPSPQEQALKARLRD